MVTQKTSATTPRGLLAPELLADRQMGALWIQELRVPKHLECWPGHFPDWQVVPGVLQIDWVMSLLAQKVGGSPRLRRIEHIKFTSPLGPGQTFTMRLEMSDNRDLRFELSHESKVFSQGRLEVLLPWELLP